MQADARADRHSYAGADADADRHSNADADARAQRHSTAIADADASRHSDADVRLRFALLISCDAFELNLVCTEKSVLTHHR